MLMHKPISTRQDSLQQMYQPHELLILPERFLQIRKLLSQSDASVKALAAIVETDIMISASLLKTANSAAYNPLSKSLSSVPQAIARLGLATSAQISMSMSLFQDIRLPIALKHLRQFWAHSFAVSQLCLRMLEQLKERHHYQADDMFMAGLFHDIGCILIALHIDSTYFEQDLLELHGAELCDVERQMYGLNHMEVGGIMLQQWAMPATLIEIVKCHHQPKGNVLAEICSAADKFTHEYWDSLQYIDAAQRNVHDISDDDIRAWMEKTEGLAGLLSNGH